jgi:hypothetical protein
MAAMLNPAQWGLLERSEADFWWSDRQPLHDRRDDYGFSMGRGLGISYRHRIGQAPGGPRGVGDYQIGLGWTDRMGAGGIAYGFSGPGRSAFGRNNFVALGRIIRPTSWLSLGSVTRLSQGVSQGVADVGRLTATGWADDGLVEVVEDPSKRFVVGVQWHPEELDDKRLFHALVSAAVMRDTLSPS